MNLMYPPSVEAVREPDGAGQLPWMTTAGVGILVDDPVNRRLVEAASIHVELRPVVLCPDRLELDRLLEMEVIVADDVRAIQIRAMLSTREKKGEGINPAVIAVRSGEACGRSEDEAPNDMFDGVLTLPAAPAPLAAQLSVIVYAHRAFARRYQTALEELHLNRRIFQSVTSGISVSSATMEDMPLVYVNPAFEVMTGYSLEEVLGRNCRFLQGKDRNQPALTLVREALTAQREVTVVLKNYRKDGTCFWNELSLSPIRNREGELTHVVGIQTDVTSRMEFEAALRESEKLAAVGRLASTIAHEINNPLESVMNLVYLAEGSESQAEAKSYLQTADLELRRVKLITSQSLRFCKQSTKPQALRCTEVLDSVLDLYRTRLQNAHVVVDQRNRSVQTILCMESEIRQVLHNLVSNAIDAMQGKGGRLLIRNREATEWRTGVKGVLMTIADTGSGMTREVLADIYKAFYTTKGIGGTGLGLWISSGIVDRHRGRLLVRSSQAEGRRGTVFELFLPYRGLAT